MLQLDLDLLYIFPKMRSYKSSKYKFCLKKAMFINCLADKSSYLKQFEPTN